MRYLIKYNEGIWWDKKPLKQDLVEDVESYLAYLIDDGFQIDTDLDRDNSDRHDTGGMDIHIYKPDSAGLPSEDEDETDTIFFWNDIRDQFIPFITRFYKEYTFESLKLYSFYGSECRTFRKGGRLENLLSDTHEVEEELKEIVIKNIKRL